jgi:hypothetical protein
MDTSVYLFNAFQINVSMPANLVELRNFNGGLYASIPSDARGLST